MQSPGIALDPEAPCQPVRIRRRPETPQPAPSFVDVSLAATETFEEYYQRDYRSLVGLAYVLTGSEWAAEDLAHDAMITAHRKWSTIRSYDNPGAWVRRVMVNRSTSRFRKLKTESKTLVRLRGQREPLVRTPDVNADVWAAVRSLPTRQAQVIALYYWDDLSLAQIAEVLDCGTETVKTHLSRARAKLGSELAAHDPRGADDDDR